MADNGLGKGSWIKTAMMLLSVMISFILTFLLQPQVYNGTSRWVKDYAMLNYGGWTEGLAAFLWFCASALLLFALFNLIAAIMGWMVMTYLMSRGWID